MKFINFLRDGIYDLYQYIIIVLIIGVVSLVLYTTITSMYQTDYNELLSSGNKEIEITETREKEANEFELFFPENANILDFSKILVDADVITDQEDFLDFVKENNLENELSSGSYIFRKNMDYNEILDTFTFVEESKENTEE